MRRFCRQGECGEGERERRDRADNAQWATLTSFKLSYRESEKIFCFCALCNYGVCVCRYTYFLVKAIVEADLYLCVYSGFSFVCCAL